MALRLLPATLRGGHPACWQRCRGLATHADNKALMVARELLVDTLQLVRRARSTQRAVAAEVVARCSSLTRPGQELRARGPQPARGRDACEGHHGADRREQGQDVREVCRPVCAGEGAPRAWRPGAQGPLPHPTLQARAGPSSAAGAAQPTACKAGWRQGPAEPPSAAAATAAAHRSSSSRRPRSRASRWSCTRRRTCTRPT
jgi:hypothetical protein